MPSTTETNSSAQRIAYQIQDELKGLGLETGSTEPLITLGLWILIARKIDSEELLKVKVEELYPRFRELYPQEALLGGHLIQASGSGRVARTVQQVSEIVVSLIRNEGIDFTVEVYKALHDHILCNSAYGKSGMLYFPAEISLLMERVASYDREGALSFYTEAAIPFRALESLFQRDSVTIITTLHRLQEAVQMMAMVMSVEDKVKVCTPLEYRHDGQTSYISSAPFNSKLQNEEEILGVSPKNILEKQILEFIEPEQLYAQGAFIVPPNFLSAAGSAERVRALIMDRYLLREVITLPPATFPHTSISTCLIVLGHVNNPFGTDFIDASSCTRVESRFSKSLDLEKVESLRAKLPVHEGQTPDKNAFTVEREQIISENNSFQLGLYRPQFGKDKGTKLGNLLTPASEHRPDLEATYRLVSTKDLEGHKTYNAQSFSECQSLPTGDSNFLGHKFYDSPAFLISAIFNKQLSVAYYEPTQGEVIAVKGSDVMVFQIDESVLPLWLIQSLQDPDVTERVKDLTSGVTISRVPFNTLLDKVKLDMPSSKESQQVAIDTAEKKRYAMILEREGLEDIVRKTKEEYENNLRISKHSLSQTLKSIRSNVSVLDKVFNRNESVGIDSKINTNSDTLIRDVLGQLKEDSAELGSIVNDLSLDYVYSKPEPVCIEEFLKDWVERNNHSEHYSIAFHLSLFHIGDGENHSKVPDVFISPKDLQAALKNWKDDFERHGMSDRSRTDYEIVINVELGTDGENEMVILEFCNNGTPFPDGLTTETYVLNGYKAGSSGNTGTGGYFIKGLMDHIDGDVEIESDPSLKHGVIKRLYFPVYRDNNS